MFHPNPGTKKLYVKHLHCILVFLPAFVIIIRMSYLWVVNIFNLNNNIDIADLQNGNHKAYEQLFAEWYVPLCNYAFSILRDQEEAKDIVQKTFYILWDQRSYIEIRTSVKSYLYRMVHNGCINKIKQIKNHFEHNQNIGFQQIQETKNTENDLLQKELIHEIETAINKLPPRCKEVFKLSRFQQLSYAEISKELHITTNTVETQIVKALRILREELKDYLPILVLMILMSESK